MADILFINGPNLNLLGKREPHIYGSQTLEDLNKALFASAAKLGLSADFFQSNAEHEIVDKIQQQLDTPLKAIVINAGALTHTSVAVRDALAGVAIPFYEVHISNVYKRESFRHESFLSDIAVGVIAGLGTQGYFAALDAVAKNQTSSP